MLCQRTTAICAVVLFFVAERFLKKSAIEFTKRNQSVTYLVVSAEDVRLLGYFTLALKPLTVRGETVSNTMKRKLLRISELDENWVR